jgi:hypothetical protein
MNEFNIFNITVMGRTSGAVNLVGVVEWATLDMGDSAT